MAHKRLKARQELNVFIKERGVFVVLINHRIDGIFDYSLTDGHSERVINYPEWRSAAEAFRGFVEKMTSMYGSSSIEKIMYVLLSDDILKEDQLLSILSENGHTNVNSELEFTSRAPKPEKNDSYDKSKSKLKVQLNLRFDEDCRATENEILLQIESEILADIDFQKLTPKKFEFTISYGMDSDLEGQAYAILEEIGILAMERGNFSTSTIDAMDKSGRSWDCCFNWE